MRITRVSAFGQWQPFVDGSYTCSGGRSAAGFDATIVRVDTDAGLVGWGEMAPLGSFYDPAFAGGARAALPIVGPIAIGHDPRQPVATSTTGSRSTTASPTCRVTTVGWALRSSPAWA